MKKTESLHFVFLITSFLLFNAFAIAQTRRIDSLKQFLQTYTKQDTIRANALVDLSRAYLIELNDKEKMGRLAEQLLELSAKLDYKRGMGCAYLSMGTVNLGKSNFEDALRYYYKAEKLLKQANDKKLLGSCYNNIGNTKSIQGKFQEALENCLKGARYKFEANDKQGLASSYNNVALNYTNLGNYQKSLEYHFKSLRIKEEINDKFGISVSFLNIGNVFNEQGKFAEAKTYFFKALPIKTELGDKEGESMIYNNLANTYTEEKKYLEALTYHLKGLKLKEEIGDKAGIAMSYVNIGNNYVNQGKADEALKYLLKSVELSTELSDQRAIIEGSTATGMAYEQKKDYQKALMYYKKALEFSKQSGYKLGIRNAYSTLASVYEKLNNYKEALVYNKLWTGVKDTLLNEESMKQAAELNTRYETDKKESEIQLLTKDQQLKDKSLKEQRLVRIGLIIGLGLFLALSFLLFNRYRYKQKANLILQKQKEEIHQKNTLITDSIDYAKTIQEAILPDDEKLTTFLPEHFILYKPKAIVSGDFYWIGKKGKNVICAVADCTGHGVPGAFMSLLGHNILENVIQRNTSIHPGAILTTLNQEIVARFSKGKELQTVKHGMDIAIISMDETYRQLNYAGARNSLYIVREKKLIELKADKMSTGIVANDHSDVNYRNNEHDLQKGDMLYMFSDGFPDQKGGPDKKKFFYQPFKDLLCEISVLTIAEQHQKLDEAINNWIDCNEQIDDILVMGIRIP
ncbi:MAG TPA: tetratricopeptide repeat protein, partial [Bacteroidia bacterium]|nr:tetratricopeptide repeat protein [Bacteroidia bacterium]